MFILITVILARLKILSINGSVKRDERGVGHMHVQFLLVRDSLDRVKFEFLWRPCLLIVIFPFLLTPVKLKGQIEII